MHRTVVNALPLRNSLLTKEELLNGLNGVLNNFLYGFVCSKLVPPDRWRDAAQKSVVFRSSERDIEIGLGPLARRAFDANHTPRERVQKEL